jgi:hypothetical protein
VKGVAAHPEGQLQPGQRQNEKHRGEPRTEPTHFKVDPGEEQRREKRSEQQRRQPADRNTFPEDTKQSRDHSRECDRSTICIATGKNRHRAVLE